MCLLPAFCLKMFALSLISLSLSLFLSHLSVSPSLNSRNILFSPSVPVSLIEPHLLRA